MDRELEEVAREELGEYPEKKTKCIQEIREWILNDQKLNFCTDDDWIVRCLRCSKYDIDKTKRRMMNYYTLRKRKPEWFGKRDCESEEIKMLLNLRLLANFGQHPEKRSHIWALTFKDLHPSRLNDLIKLSGMAIETDTNSNAEVYGIIMFIDCTFLSLHYLRYFTYDMVSSFVKGLNETMPIRVKAIHLVNYSHLLHPLLQLVKLFLSIKMKHRMFLHLGLNSVHREIPINCLPSDYGGTKEDFQYLAGQLSDRIINHQEYFKRDDKFGFEEESVMKNLRNPK